MHRFGIDDLRYREWISYVFDRPSTPDGWYFDCDDVDGFVASPAELVDLVGTTMLRAGRDLHNFTNSQVKDGLNYIFNPACSDQPFCFADRNVSVDKKAKSIRAIRHLYKDLLEIRCHSGLYHLGESTINPLNYIACMLWDFTPIFYNNRQFDEIKAAVMEVLNCALQCRNEACIEGGLHGLGEYHLYLSGLTEATISRFLLQARDIEETEPKGHDVPARRPVRRALREYARLALVGNVL